MRTFFYSTLFVVLTTVCVFSQIPRKIHYQGVLAGNGAPGPHDMFFEIYDGPETDPNALLIWSQNFTGNNKVVVKGNGIFNVVLSVPNGITFDKPYFLQLTVDSDPAMIPREQLGTSPYSFHSEKSEHANNADNAHNIDDDIVSNGKIQQGAVTWDKIGNSQVKGSHLEDNTITSGKIGNSQVKGSHLEDNTITSGKIGNAQVKGSHLEDNTITSGKIGNSEVKSANIEPGAVTTVKIANSTILFEDIGQNGATANQVIKWNSDNSAWIAANDETGPGIFLPLAGGTMTGAITNTGNPSITMGKGNFGNNNTNTGTHSFVAGSYNLVSGDFSAINGGGGLANTDGNVINGGLSVIGGGKQNYIGADVTLSTIGGGIGNRIETGPAITVGATIGGGSNNEAIGHYSFVGGGGGISPPIGYGNRARGDNSTISGGRSNLAYGNFSTIGGGDGNRIDNETGAAGGHYSAILGGSMNNAIGEYSFIGGGQNNTAGTVPPAQGSYVTISGGGGPAVADGNSAFGEASTIGGGRKNTATGHFSTIPGGQGNFASGMYSFATGRNAYADDDGSFVWGDNQTETVSSTSENQFVVRASGGMWLGTDSDVDAPHPQRFIQTSTGAFLSTGGVWSSVSDRNKKENFMPIDGKTILGKLAKLPITMWNYKAEIPEVKHIGPTAQDFYEIFGLGNDEKTISTIDPSGIALAAIQQLKKENDAMRSEMNELQAQVNHLTEIIQSKSFNTKNSSDKILGDNKINDNK
ncbi:MAG: tail fiber domain-containing protein [Ignavibacteriae bacterium]|nr:tail fiber domain-containing protein [Ignavibacteriota bacterium]